MKNIRNPTELYNYYQGMLLNRVVKMFEWQGAPETIDIDFLNVTLLTNGNICFTKINNKLYALFGNVGGEPNEYYFPTRYIIANPVLGSKNCIINVDCVVMFNTTIDRFVQPKDYQSPFKTLIDTTAQQLAEITISVITALKNIRAAILISAKDEQTKTAAELALKDIYSGEPAKVFKDKVIESLSITVNPVVGDCARAIAELREQYQFTLAQFYNAIGINANYNMKRERLNTAEVNTNTDALLINIADMLEQRRKAVDKINAMFGTSITVDFSEEWKHTQAMQESFDTETEPTTDDSTKGGENDDNSE